MNGLLVTHSNDEMAYFSLVMQRAGLTIVKAKSLENALQQWWEKPADLILSSLQTPLPQDQVKQIRAVTLVPLILLFDTPTDQLHTELLKLGADLIVPTAFNPGLLTAQIGALMRRTGGLPVSGLPTLEANGLVLDPSNRTVEAGENPKRRLTHLEFRLLYTLMTNRNQVMSSDNIVEAVWGYSGRGDRDLVRGLVNRLRAKVEVDRKRPRYILTMPGLGYKFSDDED
ncbi:MAG: response regulator transcription factor [Chloroflexota bacterium]